jgi:hypothetical protein
MSSAGKTCSPPAAGCHSSATGYADALVLQRMHSTSSQPRSPLRHCPIVGHGGAGPPGPSIGSDHA